MKRNTTKAARLLEGLTLREIGDRFEVNRSTILRDLRGLPGVEAELDRLRAQWRGGDHA